MKIYHNRTRREKIKLSSRHKLIGTTERPRLCVFRSNTAMYAQIIDDSSSRTLMGVSSSDKALSSNKGTKSEQSKLVGKAIAEKALAAGIKSVVFDRNGFIYHGRIKAVADGAREAGLQF
jgi:large subunit ribosomal protein L18